MYDVTLRPRKKLLHCEDGSQTLYSTEFDEPYHSTKDGALHESLQKHVLPALKLKRGCSSLVILDICFGLGYNSFATISYILREKLPLKVHIISPEFDEGLLRSLEAFAYPKEFGHIAPIIKALSRDLYYEDAQFKIEILLGDAREKIEEIRSSGILVDIVYQDAFSPKRTAAAVE